LDQKHRVNGFDCKLALMARDGKAARQAATRHVKNAAAIAIMLLRVEQNSAFT
jgi:hypothetical protein